MKIHLAIHCLVLSGLLLTSGCGDDSEPKTEGGDVDLPSVATGGSTTSAPVRKRYFPRFLTGAARKCKRGAQTLIVCNARVFEGRCDGT
jgi:hypothetical protein